MTGRTFVDTNVTVYAYDSSDPEKQRRAQGVLRDAAATQMGVISVQVLGEFFHATVTRRKLLELSSARIALAALQHLEIGRIEETTVQLAVDLHERWQLRYWDALIVATARLNGCIWLLSEDLKHNQNYDGVTVVNPFLATGSEMTTGIQS